MTFNEFVTGQLLSPDNRFEPLSYKLVERTASCSAWGFFFYHEEIQCIIYPIFLNTLNAFGATLLPSPVLLY